MNMRTRIVLYMCISVILCNVGCENGDDKKLAEDDVKNALVAVGPEDDDGENSVEGM